MMSGNIQVGSVYYDLQTDRFVKPHRTDEGVGEIELVDINTGDVIHSYPDRIQLNGDDELLIPVRDAVVESPEEHLDAMLRSARDQPDDDVKIEGASSADVEFLRRTLLS